MTISLVRRKPDSEKRLEIEVTVQGEKTLILEEWRTRPISPVVPYLFLDGIVMKARIAGKYENVSLLVAIGVNPEGCREVLGVAPGFQEDKGSWLAFLRWLKERGL